MATNTKTAGSANPPSEMNLEEAFSEALDLVNQNKREQALAVFEALKAQAEARGRVAMARSARTYLAALQAGPQAKAVPAGKPEPQLEAQVYLNRGEAEHALKILDPAIKAQGQDARLHYLKATAHAQRDETEAAAESLRQAVALDPEFMHQYRLERDFDRVRATSTFAALGMD